MSICKIICDIGDAKYACGTGFHVSNDGYILTAYHNIQSAIKIQFLHNQEIIKCILIGYDERLDVALLRSSTYIIDFLKFKKPELGKCITYGYPYDDSQILYQESCINILNHMANYRIDSVITNFNAIKGTSGSPIMNESNEVIGILTWMDSKLGSGGTSSELIMPWIECTKQLNSSPIMKSLGCQLSLMKTHDMLVNKLQSFSILAQKVTQSDYDDIKNGDIIIAIDNKRIDVINQSVEYLLYLKQLHSNLTERYCTVTLIRWNRRRQKFLKQKLDVELKPILQNKVFTNTFSLYI